MRREAVYEVVLIASLVAGCAWFKPAARTALEIAREACDVFFAGQPEDAPVGMSLDECAEHLLAGQRTAAAARKGER